MCDMWYVWCLCGISVRCVVYVVHVCMSEDVHVCDMCYMCTCGVVLCLVCVGCGMGVVVGVCVCVCV